MIKIPTMFERDEAVKGHPVKDAIKPECQWVLDGEGIATAKLDGTNVKIANGGLLKRQKPKERDYDNASYVPCDRANPADQWVVGQVEITFPNTWHGSWCQSALACDSLAACLKKGQR